MQKPVDFELLEEKPTKLIQGVHNGSRGEPRVRLRVTQFAGKARVSRIESPGTPGQRVDFCFINPPTEWILR